MNNSHLFQYIFIALIAIIIIVIILRKIRNIQKCDNSNDVCQCCSSKSICGKKKKNNTIAK